MDQETNNEYGIKVEMFISDPKYAGTISDEEAKEKFPQGWKSPKPYLRLVSQPKD